MTIAEAEIQTSPSSPDHAAPRAIATREYSVPPSATPSPITPPPAKSHLQLPYSPFSDAVFRGVNESHSDNITKAARSVVNSEGFQERLKRYSSCVLARAEGTGADTDNTLDERRLLFDIFNYVVENAPGSGLIPPYSQSIYYGYGYHESGGEVGGESNIPPYGGFRRHDAVESSAYRWEDLLLLLDFHLDYLAPSNNSSSKPPTPPPWTDPGPTPLHSSPKITGSTISNTKKRQREDDEAGGEKRPDKKRRRRQVLHASLPPLPSSPPPSPPKAEPVLIRKNNRLPDFALETLSSLGNRRHILGISIEGNGLYARMWYFDRAGSIRSELLSLDIRTPFHAHATSLAPSARSNDERKDTEQGFSPEVHAVKVEAVTDDIVQIVALLISISLSDDERLGFESFFLPPTLPLVPAPSSSRPSEQTSSSSSPHNGLEDYRVVVQGHTFALDKILHREHELYGRGTFVYKANYIDSPDDRFLFYNPTPIPIPRVVVIKLSWQLVDQRTPEDELLRIAGQHNVKGIPTLYVSSIIGNLSKGVRGDIVSALSEHGEIISYNPKSGKITILKDAQMSFHDRELCVQVMGPLCTPLYEVTDLNTFKAAFISLVKGMIKHH